MEQAYQNVLAGYPRFRLTALPSPLDRADRLEQQLRNEGCASVPRILIKRDDLLSLAMGGNKIRNLEFTIGQALAEGATDVVTAGRQQSNHCRLTAAASARAGLRAHLVLNGTPPSAPTGNLRLDHLFGAKVYFTGSDDRAWRASWIEMLMGAFSMFEGRKPHLIPVGGSDARGALGHVLAAAELVNQCDALSTPIDCVVLATATGGTQAGLVAGLRSLGRAVRVLGFAVAKPADQMRSDVLGLIRGVAHELGIDQPDHKLVDVDDSMLGGGYGVPTAESADAIVMLARSEGILADPIYTGKGFAGLLSMVRRGELTGGQTVVFIHTGGAPALFA